LPPAIYGTNGQPLLSWRVLILPELEFDELYERFHLDEPWDSPHNLGLLPEMPRIYCRPGSTPSEENHETLYQVFVGKGTAFDDKGSGGLEKIGLAKILLVVEAGQSVPWTKPTDMAYAPDEPLPPLGGLFDNKVRPFSLDYWRSRSTFRACFADCHCEHIRKDDEAIVRSMIVATPAP
jgi:hypothetical protein